MKCIIFQYFGFCHSEPVFHFHRQLLWVVWEETAWETRSLQLLRGSGSMGEQAWQQLPSVTPPNKTLKGQTVCVTQKRKVREHSFQTPMQHFQLSLFLSHWEVFLKGKSGEGKEGRHSWGEEHRQYQRQVPEPHPMLPEGCGPRKNTKSFQACFFIF